MHAAPFFLAKSKCWPDLLRLCLKGQGEVVLLCSVPEMWDYRAEPRGRRGDCSSWQPHAGGWLDPSHQLHPGCSESPLEVPTCL